MERELLLFAICHLVKGYSSLSALVAAWPPRSRLCLQKRRLSACYTLDKGRRRSDSRRLAHTNPGRRLSHRNCDSKCFRHLRRERCLCKRTGCHSSSRFREPLSMFEPVCVVYLASCSLDGRLRSAMAHPAPVFLQPIGSVLPILLCYRSLQG